MNKHSQILAETALWVGVGQMVWDAFKKPRIHSVAHHSHDLRKTLGGGGYCAGCNGQWDKKSYDTMLEGECRDVERQRQQRNQPIRTVTITLTPEDAAYWSDVRKYGCQGAGAIAMEKAKAAKAAAKAAKKGAKAAPAAQPVKVAPAPVHIRREQTEQVQDVAAINALKPKSQADLMDVLVRLRDWLAYWEVKDVAISVEGNSVVCRVQSQDNWNRVVAVWAKDIAVVRV